jgi:hypothetical protein
MLPLAQPVVSGKRGAGLARAMAPTTAARVLVVLCALCCDECGAYASTHPASVGVLTRSAKKSSPGPGASADVWVGLAPVLSVGARAQRMLREASGWHAT